MSLCVLLPLMLWSCAVAVIGVVLLCVGVVVLVLCCADCWFGLSVRCVVGVACL